MPKTFDCNYCDYSTKDNSNWNKHIKSKKHIKNIKETKIKKQYLQNSQLEQLDNSPPHETQCYMWKCINCKKTYSSSFNLKRHMPNCTDTLIIANQLELKNKELEIKDQTINKYEEELVYFKQLLYLSAEKKSKTIGKYDYINSNFPNTQPLKKISYGVFVENNKMQYINDNNNDNDNDDCDYIDHINNMDNLDDENVSYDNKIVRDILYAHIHNILDKYIGDVIVKTYKDADPSKQAIWITDSARLKYIIRTTDDKNIPRWMADVQGKETNKLIVAPIIEKLRSLLMWYQKKYCMPLKNIKYSFEERERIINMNITISEVIRDMDDGKINKKVLKYLAKYFTINKKSIEKKIKTINS
jgi:hypothetical protein